MGYFDSLKVKGVTNSESDHVDDIHHKTLHLVRGIPGSGKSTFATNVLIGDPDDNSWPKVHLEADMYHSRYGYYNFQRDQLKAAHHWCLTTAEILLLSSEQDVVVSNTFTTFAEMRPYVDFAKKFGIAIMVHTMSGNFKNIHGVPDDVLNAMKNRFESHEQIMESIRAYQPQ